MIVVAKPLYLKWLIVDENNDEPNKNKIEPLKEIENG